jgi:hypothetical protein
MGKIALVMKSPQFKESEDFGSEYKNIELPCPTHKEIKKEEITEDFNFSPLMCSSGRHYFKHGLDECGIC